MAAKMSYNKILIWFHFPKADIVISRCKMKFPYFQVYGTLYVTYPVFSSNIDGLYGVILPVFFMSVKS